MVTTADQFGRQNDATPLQPEEFEVLLLSCAEESGYAVFVPALPGCVSQGEDWDEALEWVQDAIELFLEVAERPQVDVAAETERIKRYWEPQGYLVESAKVWVNCDTGSDQSGRQHDAAPLQPEEFEVLLVSGGGEPGYSVFVPALPGCASEGDDWDEALYMIQGAIELFLEVAGRPPAEEAEDKEQLERDWTELGCLVEITTVWVNCDAGSDQ